MLWGCGFETGSALQAGSVTTGTNSIRTVTPSPRTGTYYISNASATGGSSFSRPVPGTPQEVYAAAANYPVAWTNSSARFGMLADGATNYNELRFNAISKCWDAYSDNALVAAGSVVVNEAQWHHIQLYVKIDGAAGRIVSYIDGIADIDYTGETNTGAATDTITRVRWASTTINVATYWDDCCFGTGGWPGDRRFDVALVPTSDVSNSWELSAGSDAYALIDEVPPSDADYIFMERDFSVTITDNTETISDAFQSGEVYAANGDAVPDVGDRFLVGGTGDFIGNELATAKGGAPAAGDIFEVTNNGVGTEAVDYIDRLAQFTLSDWTGDDKIPLAVTIWGRALKSEALGHTLRLTADDGALTLGNAQNLLTSVSYVYRIMETQPTSGDPWDEVAINALEIGVRGDLV